MRYYLHFILSALSLFPAWCDIQSQDFSLSGIVYNNDADTAYSVYVNIPQCTVDTIGVVDLLGMTVQGYGTGWTRHCNDFFFQIEGEFEAGIYQVNLESLSTEFYSFQNGPQHPSILEIDYHLIRNSIIAKVSDNIEGGCYIYEYDLTSQSATLIGLLPDVMCNYWAGRYDYMAIDSFNDLAYVGKSSESQLISMNLLTGEFQIIEENSVFEEIYLTGLLHFNNSEGFLIGVGYSLIDGFGIIKMDGVSFEKEFIYALESTEIGYSAYSEITNTFYISYFNQDGDILAIDIASGELNYNCQYVHLDHQLLAESCNILSLKEPSSVQEINIYPNPSNNILNISLEENESFQLLLFDSKSSLIKELTFYGKQNELNLDFLISGVYFLQIVTEDTLHSQKFIKL